HYLRIDKCILLMESIHFKKSDNFTDNAGYDDENDESLPIVGALTVMHPEEVIPQYINDMIGNSFLKVEEIPTIGIISRDANGFFLSEVKMETKISHELDLHYGEKFEEFH